MLFYKKITEVLEKSSIGRLVIFLFKRAGFLYLVFLLIFSSSINHNAAKERLIVRTLNDLKPSYSYLIDYSEDRMGLNEKEFERQLKYYSTLAKHFPDNADTRAVLGFCHYYLGNRKKAVSSYKKAIELNKYFFWYYYNLGLIYFKDGRYKDAVEILKKGVNINPDAVPELVNTSNVYYRMMKSIPEVNFEIEKRAREGYRDAYILLVLSFYNLNNFSDMLIASSHAAYSGYDEDGSFYYYAGLASYNLEQYEKAMNFLQNCLKINPNHTQAFECMALSARALGQQETSIKTMRHAMFLRETKGPIESKEDSFVLKIF